jgi:Zn finger protein HypA/HybF involved in hydrogenase expression
MEALLPALGVFSTIGIVVAVLALKTFFAIRCLLRGLGHRQKISPVFHCGRCDLWLETAEESATCPRCGRDLEKARF